MTTRPMRLPIPPYAIRGVGERRPCRSAAICTSAQMYSSNDKPRIEKYTMLPSTAAATPIAWFVPNGSPATTFAIAMGTTTLIRNEAVQTGNIHHTTAVSRGTSASRSPDPVRIAANTGTSRIRRAMKSTDPATIGTSTVAAINPTTASRRLKSPPKMMIGAAASVATIMTMRRRRTNLALTTRSASTTGV